MGQLRRRIGSAVAVAAVLVLAVPLGQAGLERLREPAGAVDRPPGPATALTPAATPTTAPSPPSTSGRVARPARLATPEQAVRALARLPRGWSDLPPPPGPRARAVSLWTGSHLFFWGGDSGNAGTSHATGWLFDPVARRWHAITPAPLAGRSLAAAVWTGEEILVWGSTRRDKPGARDGAAFDPRANRWRTIAAAPAALNLAGWPSPSTVWTGREMIVIGSHLDGNNLSTRPNATGLAYDPAADAWRTLPPVRLSPQASAAAWTGSGVLAWDYDLRAALYNPERNAWRRLPGPPMDACEMYPDIAANGRVAFARGCGDALWDVEAGRWVKVQKTPRNGQGRIVAAGPVFLVAGASHESSGNGLVAYHP